MKSLPANLILEKNQLGTKSAWIILVEIQDVDGVGTALRYAANNEDVEFDGNTYTAFPLQIDSTRYSSKGEIPTVRLSVSNVTQILQSYLSDYEGLVGKTVLVTVVNSDNLGEDYSELEIEFSILDTESNPEWVIFTLGASNPLRKRFPLQRYMANQCNWADNFKGAECKYAGAETVCDGSYRQCKEFDNVENFGGHPGLGSRNLRVV